MAAPQSRPAAQKQSRPPQPEDLAETNVPASAAHLGETEVPAAKPAQLEKTVIGENTESTSQPVSKVTAKAAKGAAPAGGKKQKKVTQLGDFKVMQRLGKGGMGEVYLAVQVSLDRKVALKTLSKELAKREDFVKRFLREARSMAKLQHPNVVQVYAADSLKGVHFAAIEYIDGQSMQDWMDQLGKLSVGDAVLVTLVCADALRHAHEQNMIHRDIKPDNILVTKKGEIKVADFGLAKALDEDVSMTQSGTGLGTPLYMAPEQARNAKHVDARSDIYALGTTLYYFLTGELPFTGESTLELITNKETGRFTPARRLNDQVPDRLDLMIDKMMAKDPQHRYATCEEIIRDLQSLNVANQALSFIEGAGSGSVVRRGVPTTVGSKSGATAASRSALALSSAEDAARTDAQKTARADKRMWIIQHTNASGKRVISTMTTAQIQQGIRADIIDVRAKAKLSAKDKFLPLAQYREFDELMEKRQVREAAQSKAGSMQEIFQKLDRQDRRRKRWRFLRRWTENATGFVGLLIWLAVVAAVLIGGGWAFFEFGLPFLKDLIGAR